MYVGLRCSVEIQNKIKCVELFNEKMRYEEERALLTSEMNNLLRFYHRIALPALSQDIVGIFSFSKVCVLYARVCTYMYNIMYIV